MSSSVSNSVLMRERPARGGEQHGKECADRRRLRRREQPDIDAADGDHDDGEHRQRARRGAQALAPRHPFARRAVFGMHGAQDRDGDHEHAGEQQPRQHAGEEQPADRLLGQDGIDHHAGARRNEDAERAAGRDHAGREAVAVAVAAHLRQRDLADGRRARDRGAGQRREAGAACDGRAGKPAAPMPDPGVGRGVEVARHAGQRRELPHQHEQRNDAQRIERGDVVGLGAEQRRGRRPVGQIGKAEPADQQHGNADRHPQAEQHEQDDDADDAGERGAHAGRLRRFRRRAPRSRGRAG